MVIPGPLCPFDEGRHAMRPWKGDGLRSGFACVRCSKTWTWINGPETELRESFQPKDPTND